MFPCRGEKKGGGTTVDYCASDDGDGTNAVAPSGANWANEFSNAAGGDFTLVAGGNCEGGGTDDPGSGLYSNDMDGDAYTSPWSIGVDAKTAAGGASFMQQAYYHRMLAESSSDTNDVAGLESMSIHLASKISVRGIYRKAISRIAEEISDCIRSLDIQQVK